jgi:hypothetical protein
MFKKKKRRGERKTRFASLFFCFSSFFSELPIPSVTVPASCALTEIRNFSLIGMVGLKS